MGYKMIEISSEKQDELAEHAEQVLRHAGKLMQCIEDMCEESEPRMGFRRGVKGTGRYGMRGGMGYRNDSLNYRNDSMTYRNDVMGYRESGMGYKDEDGMQEGMSEEHPRQGMMGYRDPYYN